VVGKATLLQPPQDSVLGADLHHRHLRGAPLLKTDLGGSTSMAETPRWIKSDDNGSDSLAADIRTLILCTILILLSFYLAVQSLSACDGPTPLHYNDDGQAALCKWSGTVRYADNN
jgi:hypothetical protein